ncbi:alpha/beta fold hydrolase [Nonomuraea sp. NPDC049158]|uniref:alpha/beta fold hydrolase n=1 Tax=Nonomuraea sp. NPDC049158 TaxID=3155649 RepID=UPI0033DCFAD8
MREDDRKPRASPDAEQDESIGPIAPLRHIRKTWAAAYRPAVEHVRAEIDGQQHVNLIGASFGGGITAFYASRYPKTVDRLVLFNPALN